MNILMVLNDPGIHAGTERSALLGAAGLRSAGHRVYLLYSEGDPPAAGSVDGFLRLPGLLDQAPLIEPAAVRAQWAELLAYLQRHDIDVAHLHVGLRPRVFDRLSGCVPVVQSVHLVPCPNGMYYWWDEHRGCDRRVGLGCLTVGYRSKGCGRLGNGELLGSAGFLRAMSLNRHRRQSIAASTGIIAPSRWLAARLVAEGIAPERLRVIPPPLQPPAVLPAVRRPSAPEVTYVGRLVEMKGVDQLLRASRELDVAHRLRIIGEGPARTALERLTDELGLRAQVSFLGPLAPDGVSRARATSSVCVVPSRWPEVFGMVGPESLASGVPVVATAVGGIPEWGALGGPMVTLVPPGGTRQLTAALRQHLVDPPPEPTRRRVAEEVIQTLGLAAHARALEDCYRSASADRRRYHRRAVRARTTRVPPPDGVTAAGSRSATA